MAIGLIDAAMAGHVPGHDTCEVGGGVDDIYNLSAQFDDNGNADSTDDVIVVELELCADPNQSGNRTKYRVHFDHTTPLFSVDGTSDDRDGDTVIDESDLCATTSDDGMARRGNKDTGPGIIEFIEEDGMFFLVFTVLVDDLNPSLVLDDTVYIWADTQRKGIIDQTPDTDALSDGCAKPEVEAEVVALTLTPPVKIVFVTSTTHRGDFGKFAPTGGFGGFYAGASICQDLADAAGLEGDYLPWLNHSGGRGPYQLFQRSSVPYVRTDGVKIADNWNDLTDGSLDAAISRNEMGQYVENKSVWTGLFKNGSNNPPSCSLWTDDDSGSGNSFGRVGYTTAVDYKWSFRGQSRCSNSARLYCFQQ
jgi:hypothetical protein